MGNARPSGDTREGPPARAEFGKGGRVEEGFLEEATSKQKPQDEEESEEKRTLFQARGKAGAEAQRQGRAGLPWLKHRKALRTSFF